MTLKYNKTFVATAMAAVLALIATFSTGQEPASWTNVAVGLAGVVAVFTAPNAPTGPSTKYWLAMLSAVLMAVVTQMSAQPHGAGAGSWLQVGVAAVGALAVYLVPNTTGGAVPAPPAVVGTTP